MDGAHLVLFLIAAFLGGLTSGLSGFAMGLVVSGIWLHIITPAQNATLIVFYGLLTQGYGIWRTRHTTDWRKVVPYVAGGLIGVPTGATLLTWLDRDQLRIAMGAMLIVYSLYTLFRPAPHPARAYAPADFGIGVANGLIGGLTGLGGVIVTIWCQLRGGSKDEQRAIFQPVIMATFLTTIAALAAAGTITIDTMKLYLIGLPAMASGIWCGWQLYGRLDDAAFRKIILVLLLASGISLILPHAVP